MMRPTPRRSNGKSSLATPAKTASCWSVLRNVRATFGSLAPARRQKRSVEIMKKNRKPNQAPPPEDDLLPEYRLDYSKARPNRFAARLKRGSRAVVLDPDVAAVFSTPDPV